MYLSDDYPEVSQAFSCSFHGDDIGEGKEFATWQEAWLYNISLWSNDELTALRKELIELCLRFPDPKGFDEAAGKLGAIIRRWDEPGGILGWRDEVMDMLEDHMSGRGITLN